MIFKGDYRANAPAARRYIHKIDLLKTLRNKFNRRTRASFSAFPEQHPIGSLAPDFHLRAIDGRTIRLSDFRGKTHVVLEFGSYA